VIQEVETLVFNDTQITSPTNGNNPTWGGVLPHHQRNRQTPMRDHPKKEREQ
jgi:hypothetical protein